MKYVFQADNKEHVIETLSLYEARQMLRNYLGVKPGEPYPIDFVRVKR